MRFLASLLACAALPLAAQTWDLRYEVPFPEGQSLPQTLVQGSGKLISGNLDTGHGGILSLNRELVRFGPVRKLEAGVELARWNASGDVQQGDVHVASHLRQTGAGVGLNAQFWLPFTGVAGEMGLIQRFQEYRFEASGVREDHTLSRTWLRVGARWRLPLYGIKPYVIASYQQPLSKDHPVHVNSVSDMSSYLNAQGSGQEFKRLWTFGVGLIF